MKSVNKVILLGNATRDPEMRNTQSGQSVVTFGIATNRVWKDASGAKQSLPEFHNLVAWGKLAEFVNESVRKGKPLYIEGYLKTRSWDNTEGTKVFRTEIVVENLVLVGPRPDDSVHDSASEPQDEYADPLELEPIESVSTTS